MDDNIKKVSNISNEELKAKILLLNKEQLINISLMAYHDVVNSSIELISLIMDT